METLEKKQPKTTPMGFKVSRDEYERINNFVNEREWKLSAFIRVAIIKEIERLENAEG